MTFKEFEKTKRELEEEIENLYDLEVLLDKLCASKEKSLTIKWCYELINTIINGQISKKLSGQIIDVIVDYRCDLEDDLEDLDDFDY